jgi:hypothetical protein
MMLSFLQGRAAAISVHNGVLSQSHDGQLIKLAHPVLSPALNES